MMGILLISSTAFSQTKVSKVTTKEICIDGKLYKEFKYGQSYLLPVFIEEKRFIQVIGYGNGNYYPRDTIYSIPIIAHVSCKGE